MRFNIWCRVRWVQDLQRGLRVSLSLVNPGDSRGRQQNIEIKNSSLEPLPGCVTVGQSPPLSKPPFFPLENDNKTRSYLAGQPRT